MEHQEGLSITDKTYLTLLTTAKDAMKQLIGNLIHLERQVIHDRFFEGDTFEWYIGVATLVDPNTYQRLYHFCNRFNFFIDPYQKFDHFNKSLGVKDYKALFISEAQITPQIIQAFEGKGYEGIELVVITDYPEYHQKHTVVKRGNLSSYLKTVKGLQQRAIDAYQQKFYIEIIKQNHRTLFLEYILLQENIMRLQKRRENGEEDQ